MFWGLLLGLIFLTPLFGLAIGAAFGRWAVRLSGLWHRRRFHQTGSEHRHGRDVRPLSDDQRRGNGPCLRADEEHRISESSRRISRKSRRIGCANCSRRRSLRSSGARPAHMLSNTARAQRLSGPNAECGQSARSSLQELHRRLGARRPPAWSTDAHQYRSALSVWSATCDETDVAFRNLPKRFDHEFLLSCPYSGLEIVEGIAPKHRHPALTHDGAGVVVSIYQMNRNADSVSPASSTASNTRSPYIPGPPNRGKRAG